MVKVIERIAIKLGNFFLLSSSIWSASCLVIFVRYVSVACPAQVARSSETELRFNSLRSWNIKMLTSFTLPLVLWTLPLLLRSVRPSPLDLSGYQHNVSPLTEWFRWAEASESTEDDVR